MLCEKCGSELTPGVMFCGKCGCQLNQPATGAVGTAYQQQNATLRIIPQKRSGLFYWLILGGAKSFYMFGMYKLYLYVDDVEYVFKSNVGQYDLSVTPGRHSIMLLTRPMRKKTKKVIGAIGKGVGVMANIYGNGNAKMIGNAMKMAEVQDSDYDYIDLASGEVMTLFVKRNNLGQIVKDI